MFMQTWSAPRVTISGQMMFRENDIANEWTARGWKPKIFGYMSIGERVPEVMTTDWNLPDMRRRDVQLRHMSICPREVSR